MVHEASVLFTEFGSDQTDRSVILVTGRMDAKFFRGQILQRGIVGCGIPRTDICPGGILSLFKRVLGDLRCRPETAGAICFVSHL